MTDTKTEFKLRAKHRELLMRRIDALILDLPAGEPKHLLAEIGIELRTNPIKEPGVLRFDNPGYIGSVIPNEEIRLESPIPGNVGIETAHRKSPFIPAEKEIMDHIGEAWAKFNTIPKTHPNEQEAFLAHIHGLQQLISMRILRREHPDHFYSSPLPNLFSVENEDSGVITGLGSVSPSVRLHVKPEYGGFPDPKPTLIKRSNSSE